MLFHDSHQWSEEVFGGCDFNDSRLTRRLIMTGAHLASQPGSSVNASFKGNHALQEGAYRLFENDRVDPFAIAEGGFSTAIRFAESTEDDLLLVQDTTVLQYSHKVRDELGDIGANLDSFKRGWLVHSSLLISAKDETTVGLIDQDYRLRDEAERGKKHSAKQRPYEEKESHKWEDAQSRSVERLGSLMDRVVTVCDREADVYDFLSYNICNGYRFLVRTAYNRALSDEDSHLWDHMRSQPVLGKTKVQIRQRGGRKARVATVTLRSAQVTIRSPYRKNRKLDPIDLWAVYIHEDNPPKGNEPLSWMLWTTESASTLDQALKVQRYYSLRWRIEEYHKAWKSGCNVEKVRMHYAANLQRLVVVLAFVAVRLLQLREWKQSKIACDTVLTTEEWQCLWRSTKEKRTVPKHPPSLKWAYYAIRLCH
ncbi:MAG: IS4 family transposase [Candidatus Electryonea clarkiae]|nr:IS4 family transposase [Candidatus Electryonea clarkiae]MDP8285938.1 IS4 family transposase [Candidatus Electryonea clarkiae]